MQVVRTKAVALLLALVVSLAVVGVVNAQYATAVGGQCDSKRMEKEILGPNSYAVRAWCSSLNSDSKAKGILDIASEPDMNTQWFTRTNTNYTSDYYRCTFSCKNTREEIKQR